jgi:hypothetical protein
MAGAAESTSVSGAILSASPMHMKYRPFSTISLPFSPVFEPVACGGEPQLCTGLVSLELTKDWSRIIASPKLEDGFFRISGRRANSARRRAPAFG